MTGTRIPIPGAIEASAAPRKDSMQDALDAIVSQYPDRPDNTGLVLGVLQNRRTAIRGYGMAGPAAPAGNSIFEIGSVTKVFTTALLALLAAEGLLASNEPVANFTSELSGYPPAITLLRLATHTAGLPKMPFNVIFSMLRNPANPYAGYSTDQLLRYLSRNTPAVGPIETQPVHYSNLGMALLGTLLAYKLGTSFEEAVMDRICKPLGMKDTCIGLSSDQERRLAEPHNTHGKRSRNWDMPAFEGAGALKSSPHDLLVFLQAHLGQAPARLAAPLQACHEIRARTFPPASRLQRLANRGHEQNPCLDQNQEGIALGWHAGRLANSGLKVLWHHGATGGYRAFVGFIQERQLAAVVLANSRLKLLDGIRGTTATDRLGFEILEHMAENS